MEFLSGQIGILRASCSWRRIILFDLINIRHLHDKKITTLDYLLSSFFYYYSRRLFVITGEFQEITILPFRVVEYPTKTILFQVLPILLYTYKIFICTAQEKMFSSALSPWRQHVAVWRWETWSLKKRKHFFVLLSYCSCLLSTNETLRGNFTRDVICASIFSLMNI